MNVTRNDERGLRLASPFLTSRARLKRYGVIAILSTPSVLLRNRS